MGDIRMVAYQPTDWETAEMVVRLLEQKSGCLPAMRDAIDTLVCRLIYPPHFAMMGETAAEKP